MTARFCVTCGSPLIDGTCNTCAPPAPNAGQAPSQSPPAYAAPSYAQPSYAQPPYPPLSASGFPGSRYIGQWNWGAFLLSPLWLMNHGRVGLGIGALVLSFIPILNVGSLGIAIWGGIKGNEVAVTGRRFSDDAQFVAVQNAWRNWGFIVLALSVILTVVAGVLEGLAAIISQTVNH